MADDSNNVDVTIKLGSDITGGIQTEAELARLKKKSKEFGDESAKSSKQAVAGMAGFEKSIGLVRKVLSGFGVGALFLSAVAGVEKIIESFGRAEQKAKDMQKAASEEAFAKSISDLADSYAKLNAQLSAAEQKENNVLEIIDMEVKARRDLQEANLAAAEEKEISEVDANAADAEEQKKVIREKYAHIRSTRASSDKVEDLVLQRQKYGTQANNDDKAAEAKEKEAEDLERKAKQLKARAENESINAVSPNEKDKGTTAKYFVEGFREFFTGDWGRMGSWQTEAGDAERDKHKANQDALNRQAEEIQKQADAARNDAKAKRESASQNRRRMEAMNGSIEAAKIAQGTAQVKSETAERDAATALDKKQAEEARKAKELADAKALLASGEGQAAQYRSQIAANNQQITDTSYQVATGKMGSNAGSKAVTELQERNRELNELLKNLLHEIEQSKQVIKKANEQARNSRGVDSTEGA